MKTLNNIIDVDIMSPSSIDGYEKRDQLGKELHWDTDFYIWRGMKNYTWQLTDTSMTRRTYKWQIE